MWVRLSFLLGLTAAVSAWDFNVQLPASISERMLRDRERSELASPISLFNLEEPECEDCMNGHPMPKCPCPVACDAERFDPFPCKGCMDGHGMPGCPRPEWCGYKGRLTALVKSLESG